MTTMDKKRRVMCCKRNYGIDLFRIMCCIGVLCYHVMDDVPGTFEEGMGDAKVIYFGASFCVLGFFLLSGYLLLEKPEISLSYIENKIFCTMSKLFGWVVFWTIIHYIKAEEMYDVWDNFVAGISSEGILPVSWFLFTYCILMIIGYPLYKLCKRYPMTFCSCTILWIIFLAIKMDMGLNIIETKTQSLWLHLYLGYFCLGMVLNEAKKGLHIELKGKMGILIFVNICTWVVYAYEIKDSKVFLRPDQYYGRWFYTIWIVSLFLIVSHVRIKNKKIQQIIEVLASNTFVVYLGHLPILVYITAYYPIKNTMMAVICIIVYFVGLEVLAECLKRLPLLRKLV